MPINELNRLQINIFIYTLTTRLTTIFKKIYKNIVALVKNKLPGILKLFWIYYYLLFFPVKNEWSTIYNNVQF